LLIDNKKQNKMDSSEPYIIFPKIHDDLLTVLNLNQSMNPNPNAQSIKCPLTNEQLQKIIYNRGPVIGTINNKSWWSNGGQPVWTDAGDPLIGLASTTIAKNANHTIIIIGWGTYRLKGQDEKYWVIKNSWGVNWAYNGYTAVFWPKELCSMFDSIAYIDSDKIHMDLIKNTPGWKKTYSSESPQSTKLKLHKFKTGPVPPPKPTTGLKIFRYGGFRAGGDASSPLALLPTSINKNELDITKPFKKFFCWATKDNYLKRSITSPVQEQGKCDSCWIFDCLDILASSIAMKDTNNKVVMFSVQKFISTLNITDIGGVCGVGGTFTIFNDQLKNYPLYSNSICPYENINSCTSDNVCDTNIDCDLKCTPKKNTNGIVTGHHKDCCKPKSKSAKTTQSFCNKVCTGDADGVAGHPYSKTQCKKMCDCTGGLSDTKAISKGKSNLGSYAGESSDAPQTQWNVKTIIFLILMILFSVPIVYQLFKRFRSNKKINYNILIGSAFLFTISGILFVLFLKHMI